MRRRDFIAGLGSAAAWPLAARSQQQAVPLVGVLSSGSQAEAANISAFQEGLRSTGYDEGRNVVVEHRWSSTLSGRTAAIATFVERGVAVIVTTVNSATHAAKAATSTIPIVFFYGGDPVDEGLIDSLNKPGSNLTGVTSFNIALGGKRLSLLGEMVPQAMTIAFLSGDSTYLHHDEQRDQLVEAGSALQRQIIVQEVRNDRNYEAVFKTFVQRQAGALIVGAFAFPNFKKIVELAARYKLPTIYPSRAYVAAGGLMSYSPLVADLYRVAGTYVGRILKGEKPANLPIMRATRFELVVNLKTAMTLGLAVPRKLLATAEE
jgi:putative tryptophan/tyrosine transport system substrate-binding protein